MHRLILVAVLVIAFVQAQKEPLYVTLERFLVTEELKEGETVEVLSSAFELLPGDLFEETLTAKNVSEDLLKGLSLELPIPAGTYYLEDTANSLDLSSQVVRPEFSFDDGLTFAYPPLFKKVTVVENGKEVMKDILVKPEDYTHVRWFVAELEPDLSLTASFRAVVR